MSSQHRLLPFLTAEAIKLPCCQVWQPFGVYCFSFPGFTPLVFEKQSCDTVIQIVSDLNHWESVYGEHLRVEETEVKAVYELY